jgi:hypothetical protein
MALGLPILLAKTLAALTFPIHVHPRYSILVLGEIPFVILNHLC